MRAGIFHHEEHEVHEGSRKRITQGVQAGIRSCSSISYDAQSDGGSEDHLRHREDDRQRCTPLTHSTTATGAREHTPTSPQSTGVRGTV